MHLNALERGKDSITELFGGGGESEQQEQNTWEGGERGHALRERHSHTHACKMGQCACSYFYRLCTPQQNGATAFSEETQISSHENKLPASGA